MPPRKKATEPVHQVDWESEHFTFRSIWHAANVLRQAGEKDEEQGFWPLMGSLVLAYTAYEGFLNHLIERVYPAVWLQERTFFRAPPFEGTLGKTRFIAESAGLKLKTAEAPYRSVAELHAWRNELVHPRSIRESGIARADVYARRTRSTKPVAFKKLAQSGFVDRCFTDLEKLSNALLLAMAENHHHVRWQEIRKLGQLALWGPVGMGGGSLRK